MILQVTSYKQDLQNGQLTMLMVMSVLCGKVSGKESLHAMNMVCSITSQGGRMSFQTSLLKREKVQSIKEIMKHLPTTAGLSAVKFKDA